MQPALKFLLKNKSLNYPRFRNYLLMRFFIVLALDMQSFIIYYWIYKLTHDVALVGILGLCEAIPAIGCSFFSGYFVDQLEKKKTIAVCIAGYLLLALFFGCISLPSVEGSASVSTIVHLAYLGVFIGGVLRAFLSPASFAIMGLLLPRRQYANGTTWSSTAWQTGAVIGPVIGGFMLIWGVDVSLFSVFFLELVSLIALLRIPTQAVIKKEQKEPILQSLREGLRFVFRTQVILAALSLDMFAVLFGGAVALLPAYVKDVLHVSVVGLGWLRAAPGIGSVVSILFLTFLPLNKNPGYKLLACVTGFGLVTVIFGLSTNFYLSFFMLLIAGMFDQVSVVIRSTILQLYTPDGMRGRVGAVNTMFVSSSNELGAVESGYTAKWMGLVPSVVFGGCMTMVVVGVTYFAAPVLRTLRITEKRNDKKEEN